MRMNKTLSYLNRELSWIEFNNRVLLEAQKESVPLLEKLKFLLIVSSNFDEFFKVRLAELKKNAVSKPEEKDISGLTNKEQLAKVSERTKTIIANQYSYLNKELMPQLAEKVSPIYLKQTIEEDISFLSPFFQDNIFPILTPVRLEEMRQITYRTKLNVAFYLNRRLRTPLCLRRFAIKKMSYLSQPFKSLSLPKIIWLPEMEERSVYLLKTSLQTLGRVYFRLRCGRNRIFRLVNDAAFSVDEQRDFDL